MIYNDKFVWLHLPKCAGTKIEKLFIKYLSEEDGLHQDILGLKNDPTIAWHDSLLQRRTRDPKFKLGNRTVICSFRKLPSWLESRYNYGVQRSPEIFHDPKLLLEGKFTWENNKEGHADLVAKKYLPENLLKSLLKSGRVEFIRTEFFESDFKSIFSKYIDISKIPDWEYTDKVNTSNSALPDDIKEKLYTNADEIYKKCPYWEQIEMLVYKS